MNKKNDQNAETERIKLEIEASKLAIEEKKLAIEEKKLEVEKEQHLDNLSVEKEKIKLEKSKTWVTPIFTIILAVISLSATAYVAYWSRKEIEASRVEMWTHTSNKKMPYSRANWVKYLTDTSIGLKSRVTFKKNFSSKPSIAAVFSLINLKTPRQVFEKIDNKVIANAVQKEPSMNQVAIHCFATDIDNEGFTLFIVYGVKQEFIKTLKDRLEQLPDADFVKLITTGNDVKLPYKINLNDYTDDEKWVLNFHQLIGTVDVTWIAQSNADLK